jgi:hypothetical protein
MPDGGGDLIGFDPVAAPPRDSAAFGKLCGQVVEARLLGLPTRVPAAVRDELLEWAEAIIAGAKGAPRGVRLDTVPAAWLDVLRWAGVPLALAGELHWGTDIVVSGDAAPEERDGRLLLPRPERLAELSSLAIRPLRTFLGRRLACRLQAATGLRLFLWPNQALVVSQVEIPVGGFLFGPPVGHRASLALPPGGAQVVDW